MKVFIIPVVLIVIIVFGSCNDKTEIGNPPAEIFYLSDNDKTHFPFFVATGLPTYLNGEDTIEFIYGKLGNMLIDYPIPQSESYIQYEMELNSFLNDSYVMDYYLRAGSDNPAQPLNMTIGWSEPHIAPEFQPPYTIDFDLPFELNTADTAFTIYDSLLVNEVWYTDVLHGPVYFSPVEGNVVSEVYPVRFYYSSQFGILQLDMSDDKTWVLKSEL